MGHKLTKAESAEMLGISLPAFDNRVRRGMPCEKKGSRGVGWVFDSAEIITWEKEQAVSRELGKVTYVDDEELKNRKLKAETVLQEIEVAKKQGEVISVEDAAREIQNDYITIRSQLLSIPSRIAPLIIGETDETKLKEVIGREVENTLGELSNRYFAGFDDLEEGNSQELPAIEATAEAHSQ